MRLLQKQPLKALQITMSCLCTTFVAVGLLVILQIFISCKKSSEDNETLLVELDGEKLRVEDVVAKIPAGISYADSCALFSAITESWLKSKVLTNLAKENLNDLPSIEHKVEEYRNKLIVMEYLERLRETEMPSIDRDSIISYYEKNKSEFVTAIPYIKGMFITVSENSKNLERLKNLMASGSEADIDTIENIDSSKDFIFDYFGDKWRGWSAVEEQIPYRFADADGFLAENSYFETNFNNNVYILKIFEYIPSQSEAPIEIAETIINDILLRNQLLKIENDLVTDLIEKALKEGRLVAYGVELPGVLDKNK